MAIPVIIDTDPGLDDALALMVAFASEELDVKAILSVSGNQSIEKTTANAAKIIQLAGKDIPLVQGADRPLVREKVFAADIHGESGLGSVKLPPVSFESAGDPIQVIYEHANKYAGKLEIIALGPLTNIAKAILLYPNLKDLVARIVLMGGGHAFGNVTPSAEFNIYADAEAAKIVFESGIPIVMVGLDATHDLSVDRSEVDELIEGDGETATVLKQFLLDLIEACEKFFNVQEAHLHDVLAVIAVYDRTVLSGDYYHVDIETKGSLTYGKTVVDIHDVYSKEKNAFVALHADKKKAMSIMKEKLRHYV